MGSTVQICCLIKILRDSQIKLTKQEYVKCTASKPCRNNQWNKAVCYSNSSPHQKCRNQSNRNWKHHTADDAGKYHISASPFNSCQSICTDGTGKHCSHYTSSGYNKWIQEIFSKGKCIKNFLIVFPHKFRRNPARRHHKHFHCVH